MKCPYCQSDDQSGAFCAACNAELPQAEQSPTLAPSIDAIDAADLATRTLPPSPAIVDGMVPRGLTVLAGRPKAGKSWAVADLALSVAAGSDWHGCRSDQGPVMYLALEDTHARLQQRIGKLSSAPPSCLWLATTCDGYVALAAWMEQNRPKMVVIDTLQRWRGGKASTYHRDYEEGARLKSLADKHGCAIVVVHHTTKLKANSPLDSVSGSTGLTAAADAVMVLASQDGKGALWLTGRDVPTKVLPLAWQGGKWALAQQHKAIAGPTDTPVSPEVPKAELLHTWTYGVTADGEAMYLVDEVTGHGLARKILDKHHCTRFGRTKAMTSEADVRQNIERAKFAVGRRLRAFETEADLKRLNLWHLARKD